MTYGIAWKEGARAPLKMEADTFEQKHAAQARIDFWKRTRPARTAWAVYFEDPRKD